MPRFKYFLSSLKNPVQKNDSIWSAPIPLDRQPSENALASEDDIFIRHGDCFLAARDFLQKNRYKNIEQAVSQHLDRQISFKEIDEIRIILDKHGAFYHPAKIEAVLKDSQISFVLNLAVTAIGRQCAKREYRLLNRLNKDVPFSFIPKVYAQDNVLIQMDQLEIWMFLGEWFDGFNEFHISFDPEHKKYKIVVWDRDHGNFFLTPHQTLELYRQAAKILTCYYNIETFEQISSWHHGAGDFVLRRQKDDIELKLITVRQYRSLYENNIASEWMEPDAELILEALLVFFLSMAIKMRIDRLDGVGDIVWSDDVALKGMLKGFFEGLYLNPFNHLYPAPLDRVFMEHLLDCTHSDLIDLSQSIMLSYPSESSDVVIIRKNIEKHVEDLYHAVRFFELGQH